MGFNGWYSDLEYRKKQSELVKAAWRAGKFASLIKPCPEKVCKKCHNVFIVRRRYKKKIFCSSHCAISFNNLGRKHTLETRRKIGSSVSRIPSNMKGVEKVPRVTLICRNCKGEFKVLPYLQKRRKFCSNACAMKVIGGATTWPKASKGKPGIRNDIDTEICFYSRWEANIARVFNLIEIRWKYAPTIFDLGNHTYRPDFYLPEFELYIEVKNFMSDYSMERDFLFRKLYPDKELAIISKNEYKEIEASYKFLLDEWE